MNAISLLQSLRQHGRRLLAGTLAVALALGVVFSSAIAPALAADGDRVVAVSPAESADRKAKNDLDTVAGSGTSEKLEGNVKKTVGAAKQRFGDSDDSVEGGMQRVQGNIQEGMGEMKRNMDEATNEARENSRSFMDSVRDFFN